MALTRKPILLNDVSTSDSYVAVNPEVRSELAVPLIAKNRLIGIRGAEYGHVRKSAHECGVLYALVSLAITANRTFRRLSRISGRGDSERR